MKGTLKSDSDTFTVTVRDTSFVLSRSQIEHDAPNYLTSYFLSDCGERINEHIQISRDPCIFELVLKYLNGYQVLPIHDSSVPPSLTAATALADLQADAEFFQLDGLVQACRNANAEPQYAVITGYFKATPDKLSIGGFPIRLDYTCARYTYH
jgi:hypothetical protein